MRFPSNQNQFSTILAWVPLRSAHVDFDSAWKQNGITLVGVNGAGKQSNQLDCPIGLYVDEIQTLYIADCNNHRIIEWKARETSGKVVAGGNGKGYGNDQLNFPTDVIVDKKRNSLYICDTGNRRVVRWPCRGTKIGDTIISEVVSHGLTMDESGFLFICDFERHEVKRWRVGETSGKVVAGGNGQGNRRDQLNRPISVFVDRDHSVYVSDYGNHRVMRWMKDAKEGNLVAGGQDSINSLSRLSNPRGLIVDQSETVFSADSGNNRIVRWPKGATEGNVVVGRNGKGSQSDQLNNPIGVSFDRNGHLYVAEYENCRVQKFEIDRNS